MREREEEKGKKKGRVLQEDIREKEKINKNRWFQRFKPKYYSQKTKTN